jgi:hypothetical protein
VNSRSVSSTVEMSTATKKENTVVLVTSDEGTYTVERAVAEKSGLVKTMMEGGSLIMCLFASYDGGVSIAGWMRGEAMEAGLSRVM